MEEQPCCKGPGGPSEIEAEHRSAVCCCINEGKSQPKLICRALLAEIEMQSSHSAQCLSGGTWSTVSSYGPHNSRLL